jgi:hypothetical protein
MSAVVEQFAMFMQRRDAVEQGGIVDGVARPTWEELGESGQEAYIRDATAYVGALELLGMRRTIDAGFLREHKPSRWRSFSTDQEILRCCNQDFGPVVKRIKPGAPDAWDLWADHVAAASLEWSSGE